MYCKVLRQQFLFSTLYPGSSARHRAHLWDRPDSFVIKHWELDFNHARYGKRLLPSLPGGWHLCGPTLNENITPAIYLHFPVCPLALHPASSDASAKSAGTFDVFNHRSLLKLVVTTVTYSRDLFVCVLRCWITILSVISISWISGFTICFPVLLFFVFFLSLVLTVKHTHYSVKRIKII